MSHLARLIVDEASVFRFYETSSLTYSNNPLSLLFPSTLQAPTSLFSSRPSKSHSIPLLFSTSLHHLRFPFGNSPRFTPRILRPRFLLLLFPLDPSQFPIPRDLRRIPNSPSSSNSQRFRSSIWSNPQPLDAH